MSALMFVLISVLISVFMSRLYESAYECARAKCAYASVLRMSVLMKWCL